METGSIWTRKQAVLYLQSIGVPWWYRYWLSIKWVVLRGRSIRVGCAKLIFRDQHKIEPMKWSYELGESSPPKHAAPRQ